jgi:hypothetical protein
MRASAVAGAAVKMSLRADHVVAALRGELDVCTGPQPIVLRLFSLSEMIHHWPVFASVEEAVSGSRGHSCAGNGEKRRSGA